MPEIDNRAKIKILTRIIIKNMYPKHCAGCDEYGCGGWEACDGGHEIKKTVEKILEEIEKWK